MSKAEFRGHKCDLNQDSFDLDLDIKLPPNAPWYHKLIRRFRKCLCPNPNLQITKRNFRNVSQVNDEIRRHLHILNKSSYIIHPYSNMEFYRELFFVVVATWEIGTAPLIASLSFVTALTPEMSKEALQMLQMADVFLGVFQILWIISCFCVGYKERNGIQLNPFKILKRYVTGYLFVDLLIINIFLWDDTNWINMAIIFRWPNLINYLKRFLRDLKLPQEIITCITLVLQSFLFIHIFACIFYCAPIMIQNSSDHLWVVEVGLHPNESVEVIHFGCFSMVQMHFWGLGESKIRPQNNTEEFILIIVMIVGRLWGLYVIASMLRVFTISSLSESKYDQYLTQLQTFIKHKKLPKELGDRLIEYYGYNYQQHYFNEKLIFSAMSRFLQKEVTLFRARNVIHKVKAFKFFPQDMTTSIIEKSKILVFLNNDVLVQVGTLMDTIFFINRGTVATFGADGSELMHLTDGDVLGIKAVIATDDVYHSHYHISIETTEVYAIGIKTFKEIIESKPHIFKFFQKTVEERMDLLAQVESKLDQHSVDILSELRYERILEHPKTRTRFYEQ